MLNLHVEHNTSGIDEAVTAFRRLIDIALDLGGSFYLTYHRWATRPQLLTAYRRLPSFLEAKLEHDPEELFPERLVPLAPVDGRTRGGGMIRGLALLASTRRGNVLPC